jgi:hypothetical protein
MLKWIKEYSPIEHATKDNGNPHPQYANANAYLIDRLKK